MKQITIIILGLLLALTSKSYAQETPDSILNKFFAKYAENRIEALDYIISTNPRMKQADQKSELGQARESLYKNVIHLKKVLGEYTGYELIAKKNIGESLVVYSYLIKYSLQPVRFKMTFYKASNDWKLYNFKIDSNVETELQNAVSVDAPK